MRTRPTLAWSSSGPPLQRTTRLDDVLGVLNRGRAVVLSGAGMSTESGIPDYRGTNGSLRRHTPMTYQEFVHSLRGRQRYWARSHLGWRNVAQAKPNLGHIAVAALQGSGALQGVITQNVDGLHQAAGSREVVELHGSLGRVICLNCRQISSRALLDRQLHALNPNFRPTAGRLNPDGDVDLPDELVQDFRTIDCAACGCGPIKPDVVFFGENVPKPRVQQCYRLVDEAEALLVLGSSLTVMSGLRFVRRAAESGKPVLIINQGETRGDRYASVRVDRPLGPALVEVATRLGIE